MALSMLAKLFVMAISLTSIFAWPLLSQERNLFHEGGIFFDISYGKGVIRSPVIEAYAEDPTVFFLRLHQYAMLVSSNPHDNLIGILASSTPRPTVEDTNIRFEFEYALNNDLGVGASINSTRIKINDARMGGGIFMLAYLADRNLVARPQDVAANHAELNLPIALYRESVDFTTLTTTDLDIGFHIMGDTTLDPFWKLAVGIGSLPGGGDIQKIGVLVGFRYSPDLEFHYMLDLYANQFNTFDTIERNTHYTESGAHFGIGFHL